MNVTARNSDGGDVSARADFLFEEIARWDVEPGANGAEQMALDEVMLRLADRPTLRLYRWAQCEVTFGYPQRCEDAVAFAGGRAVTRRCTGGGFVEHGEDVTIALAVPAKHAFARLTPVETYRRIHETISGAMGWRLATTEDCVGGPACFASPALHDGLDGTRKVLGGAQRRSRTGFLYQGSLLGVPPERDWAEMFGGRVEGWRPEGWEELRDKIVAERYGNASWNRRR